MTCWTALPPAEKRQAILDVLNANPNISTAEIRRNLGLKDSNNCLSSAMTLMRKRGEIAATEHAENIGRSGHYTWVALVKKTLEMTRGGRMSKEKPDDSVWRPGQPLCNPPYGSLPYEKPSWQKNA